MTEAAQVCAQCGAQVAPFAPRCPECPSTEFTQPETVKPFFDQLADIDEVLAEANREDAQVPDAAPGPAPAVPPRLPRLPGGADANRNL